MTEQELNQLCRYLLKIGDRVEMQKALMSLPKDQRQALTKYVLTVEGTPWKTPVDQ